MRIKLLIVMILLNLTFSPFLIQQACSTSCRNIVKVSEQGFQIFVHGHNITLNETLEGAFLTEYMLIKGSRLVRHEVRSTSNGSVFDFEMYLNKIGSVQYRVVIRYHSIEPHVESNVSYNLRVKQGTFELNDYTLAMRTSDPLLLLKVNITLTEFALEHKGEYEVYSSSLDGKHVLVFKLSKVNYTDLSTLEEHLGYIIGLIFSETINHVLIAYGVLEKITYRYSSTNGSTESYLDMWSSLVDHEVYGETYVFSYRIRDSTIKVPYSYVKLVVVDAVNVTLLKTDGGSINVNLSIVGRGKGLSTEESVRRVLENAVYLSKKYGCFLLEPKGFLVLDQNNNAVNTLDPSVNVTNLKITYSWESGSAKTPLATYVVVSILAALAVFITVLYLRRTSSFRVLRLKRV